MKCQIIPQEGQVGEKVLATPDKRSLGSSMSDCWPVSGLRPSEEEGSEEETLKVKTSHRNPPDFDSVRLVQEIANVHTVTNALSHALHIFSTCHVQ